MRVFSALLLVLPFSTFASHVARCDSRLHFRSGNSTAKTYTLTDMYKGPNFFQGWAFFSYDDPTHGLVNFLDSNAATSAGLAYVQSDGTTVLAVDNYTHLPLGSHRNSVRISTKKRYNTGLFVADIWAMPTGCSVWAAWWSVGPDWPKGGEIDIIEGVNQNTRNQYTIHSAPGCTISSQLNSSLHTGNILNKECASSGANNAGCAFSETAELSFGQSFNNNGGGVYVHLWDKAGIKAWFFPRTAIPGDIKAQNPNPTSWGPPSAFWSSKSCNVNEHFFDHVLTFDTTFCGDWAGGAYQYSGCPGTCEQAVTDPGNFSNAKWKINYVAVYN